MRSSIRIGIVLNSSSKADSSFPSKSKVLTVGYKDIMEFIDDPRVSGCLRETGVRIIGNDKIQPDHFPGALAQAMEVWLITLI